MLFGNTVSLQIGRDAFGIIVLDPQLSVDNINADDTSVNPFVLLVSSDHPQIVVRLTVDDDFIFSNLREQLPLLYAHERLVIQFFGTFLRVPFDDDLLGFAKDNQFEMIFAD